MEKPMKQAPPQLKFVMHTAACALRRRRERVACGVMRVIDGGGVARCALEPTSLSEYLVLIEAQRILERVP